MGIKVRTAVVILIFSVLYTSCSKNGGGGDQNPPPPNPKPDTLSTGWTKGVVDGGSTGAFTDVFFPDATIGYATSESGIYRSTNGGLNWTMVYGGLNFINIAARGTNACFVNQSDTIYFTTNNGATIQKRRYPSPNNAYPNGFSDLYYTPAGKCFAASSRYVFRSLDGGVLFDSLFAFSTASNWPNTLWFLDELEGWVTRTDGVYRTIGGGHFWQLYTPTPPGTFQISYAYPIGYATAPNAVYKTSDNGNSWQNVFSGTLNTGIFLDVAIINQQTAYFCYGNRVYKTTNGGANWTVVAALGEGVIIEIHFLDTNTGWACGSNGTILRFKL